VEQLLELQQRRLASLEQLEQHRWNCPPANLLVVALVLLPVAPAALALGGGPGTLAALVLALSLLAVVLLLAVAPWALVLVPVAPAVALASRRPALPEAPAVALARGTEGRRFGANLFTARAQRPSSS